MTTNFQTPYEVLTQMFSQRGFCKGGLCVRLKSCVTIEVDSQNGDFIIKFPNEYPEVVYHKIFSIKAFVKAIRLSHTYGVVELKSFPDIRFSYDWIFLKDENTKTLQIMNREKLSRITRKIKAQAENKIDNGKKREILQRVLTLCEDWAIIKSKEGFLELSNSQAKKDCKKYVYDHLKKDVSGFSFIFSIVLNLAIKMLIEWIIDNYINEIKMLSGE